MAAALWIWGIIASAYGVIVLAQAKSAIHEIEVGVALLIATVSFGFAAVIQAIKESAVKEEQVSKGKQATAVNLRPTSVFRYCPNCDAMLEEGQSQCGQCGRQIEGSS